MREVESREVAKWRHREAVGVSPQDRESNKSQARVGRHRLSDHRWYLSDVAPFGAGDAR